MKKTLVKESVLPGFKLTMGITLFYLSVIIIIPLTFLFIKTSALSFDELVNTLSSRRLWIAIRLSFGASLIAAFINLFIGSLVAWVLVRYSFPLKSYFDMLVDLPIALPTAVAGISITAAFSAGGFIGQILTPLGIQVVYTPLGIILALVFVTFPFVVRTVQPVLRDLDLSNEEAAACLGANRLQTFWYIVLPTIAPALLSGFTLAFARALGEYGSVVFISGNLPLKTEIAPLLIVSKLEQYEYESATAIGCLLLIISFLLLLLINFVGSKRGALVK